MSWFRGKKPKRPPLARRAVPPPTPPALQSSWRQRGLALAAFAVIVLAITRFPGPEQRTIGYDISLEGPARETITATFGFRSVDVKRTQEAREKAAAAVPDTYRVRRERVLAQLQQLLARIEALRAERPAAAERVLAALRESTEADPKERVVEQALLVFAAELKSDSAFDAFPDPKELVAWLAPDRQSLPVRRYAELGAEEEANAPRPTVALEPREASGEEDEPAAPSLSFGQADLLGDVAVDALRYVLARGVRKADLGDQDPARDINLLRDSPVGGQRVSETLAYAAAPDPERAQEIMRERVAEALGQAPEGADPIRLEDAAIALASTAVADTLYFDNVYTAGARERAWTEVQPVPRDIQPNEILQRFGDRWTPQSREDVRIYWDLLRAEQEPMTRLLTALIANMVLTGLVFAGLFRTIALYGPETASGRQTALNLALLLLCATVAAGRGVSYFDPTGFALPVAAGVILYAILTNARLASIFALAAALLVSAQFGYDWRILITGLAMGIAGAYSIHTVRRRGDMNRASLTALCAGLCAVFAAVLATDSILSDAAYQNLLKVGLNGLMCLALVPGLLSPLERLFQITTDIQLLEYSDLNNELLNTLAMEIPGTYAHSLMLGQLAEAAADAIGANGLLARVCAYYHDIGKIRRPEYFSENQQGFNVHDELPPRVSARAIASHVPYGVELAREYHLPKPIIDGILEHHGTTLIGYFYQNAVKQQKHGDVREADFRYPGPRPQSRETAILMICDAVESGVRSIKHPNEERVREFVDKIIAARAADKQFDQCGLTLKDLGVIAEVVARRMMSALHTRVSYPDPKQQPPDANIISLAGRTP
ncbi:MAG: HDIG domain-containing protein [Nocardiopsis sp. BM-2018]|nr:MAG: HDIG domain-containing protein [Nocardiopsis sp. BM-2018]